MLRLTIGAALALSGIATPGWATEVSPSASVAIKARLFHSTSGELSVDVLGSGAPPLVNVVAGADPSKSSLVIVAVTLAPDQVIASDSHLRFVAQELAPAAGAKTTPRARILLDRTVSVGPISRGGTTHLAFWLAGTGCRPVNLQATLSPARQKGQVVAGATLPFACGE